jgi:hypothetical protein
LREWVRGNKPTDPEPFEHTGLLDDGRVRRLVSVMVAQWDPDEARRRGLPADPTDTALYRRLVGIESTESMSRAVESGQVQRASHAVGDTGMRADMSSLKTIYRLESVVSGRAPIFYLFGHMGSGKTSKACLIAQIFDKVHGGSETPSSITHVDLASNIRTLDEATYIDNFRDLKSWFKQNTKTVNGAEVGREDVKPKFYILDEASTSASGTGQSGYQVREKMAPLIYAVRKASGGIAVVGHDAKSVSPVFRALGTVVKCFKDEVKRAVFAEDVDPDTGDVRDRVCPPLTGIPDTDLSPNGQEQPRFRWTAEDEPEPDELDLDAVQSLAEDVSKAQKKRLVYQIEQARRDGLLDDDETGARPSQTSLADAIGIGQSTWSTWAREVDSEGIDVDGPVDVPEP